MAIIPGKPDLPAKVAVGEYTGNGVTTGRTIALPFTPKLVMIIWDTGGFFMSPMGSVGAYGMRYAVSANVWGQFNADAARPDLTTNGFKVNHDPNTAVSTNANTAPYRYIAFG